MTQHYCDGHYPGMRRLFTVITGLVLTTTPVRAHLEIGHSDMDVAANTALFTQTYGFIRGLCTMSFLADNFEGITIPRHVLSLLIKTDLDDFAEEVNRKYASELAEFVRQKMPECEKNFPPDWFPN